MKESSNVLRFKASASASYASAEASKAQAAPSC